MSGIPRSERARKIAGWVADRVREVAPPGLGRWDRAWEIVETPSADLLDAIHEWEDAGDGSGHEQELRALVNEKAGRVVEAWLEAAREWERAGRPTLPDLRTEKAEKVGPRHCPSCGNRLGSRESDGNWCADCFHELAEQGKPESEEARP